MLVSLDTVDTHDAASEILHMGEADRVGQGKENGWKMRKVKNSEAIELPGHTQLRQIQQTRVGGIREGYREEKQKIMHKTNGYGDAITFQGKNVRLEIHISS